MTFIIVLVIIGVPIIAVLSWIYDITPAIDGETPPIEATQSLGVYALTGLVLTVIGFGFWIAVGVFGVSFGWDDEVPSIAIIPFDNKGEEEDEFYAYGISSDLISDVASAGLIRVASLNDIEKLEYKTLDASELSEKLFIRYIAQGTIWKKDSIFQLSMELYDTRTERVTWSERWEKNWDKLTTIKDELADNILDQLKVDTKTDTPKFDTSPEAYEFYLRGKHMYEKMENADEMNIARGLLRKALELDENLLLAKNVIANTYFVNENYDKAMDIYSENLKRAEDIGNMDIISKSLNNIGEYFRYIDDYDKALDYYDRSLKIKTEIGDKRGADITLNNIGNVYTDKGDYDKALDYYGRSLAICEVLGDKSGMGVVLNKIGEVYTDKGNYDKALDYYERSLKIDEELGDKYGMGVSLVDIGNIYGGKGNYDKALDYYERSLKIDEELGDKSGMGISLGNIGNVHSDKGDYNTALDYYDRSLNISDEIGDKSGMGYLFRKIGNIYSDQGDYDKALDYYERSLKIDKELGDKYGMRVSLVDIGNIYGGKGNYDTALDYYESSLKIDEELGNKNEMGYVLLDIGVIYHNIGNYDKAIEYLQMSHATQAEVGLDNKLLLWVVTHLSLISDRYNKEYNSTDIRSIIKETNNIGSELNYRLYQLLEDIYYLQTAYSQVQELADNLEDEVAAKFLSYPIPKAIIEEWEKVK